MIVAAMANRMASSWVKSTFVTLTVFRSLIKHRMIIGKKQWMVGQQHCEAVLGMCESDVSEFMTQSCGIQYRLVSSCDQNCSLPR